MDLLFFPLRVDANNIGNKWAIYPCNWIMRGYVLIYTQTRTSHTHMLFRSKIARAMRNHMLTHLYINEMFIYFNQFAFVSVQTVKLSRIVRQHIVCGRRTCSTLTLQCNFKFNAPIWNSIKFENQCDQSHAKKFESSLQFSEINGHWSSRPGRGHSWVKSRLSTSTNAIVSIAELNFNRNEFVHEMCAMCMSVWMCRISVLSSVYDIRVSYTILYSLHDFERWNQSIGNNG